MLLKQIQLKASKILFSVVFKKHKDVEKRQNKKIFVINSTLWHFQMVLP
jgi:hypothetical protein